MNAIVGLCHFCEAHGPRALFCTFTTDEEKHTIESSKTPVQCNGCTTIGPETVLVSRDDNGTIYCSRESVPNADVTAFLRQAAIRSITCEVSWSKEGGVVYFSDTQGHVLSLMFQIADTRARGLKRWFSIVVLMKDKMLLLNITPVLSEHMHKIAKELQDQAEIVFNDEQKVCSQRALRLNTGRNDFGQSRSLMQLTGNEDIFKKLHAHFTWMLKAGALNYTETLFTSSNLLHKLNPKANAGVFEENACTIQSTEDTMSLRDLEKLVSKNTFRILLYCCLIGIQIVIKCVHKDPSAILKGLTRLQPITAPDKCSRIKIVAIKDSITASLTVCVLKETENSDFDLQWSGVLPTKCPTVMSRIESGMANSMFNEDVLHQHVKSLLLEWLGTTKTIKSAIQSSGPRSEAVVKLSQVLGVTPQDEALIQYWIHAFCD